MPWNKHTSPGNETITARLYPFIVLLPTTALSIAVLSIQNAKYTGSILSLVQSNRASLQIIVQVVSHGVALLQISTLRSIFNFSSRLRIRIAPMHVEKLSLWTAIATTQVDFNLSVRYLAICLLVALLCVVPGALWTGALTPVIVSTGLLSGTIDIPRFSASSAHFWNSEFEIREPGMDLWNLINNCQQVHDQRGFIPSCPVPALQPLLLLSASSATTIDGSPRLHAKLDNSQWTYIGRSYGVGASVALAALVAPGLGANSTASGTETYQYIEDGYLSNVTCIKNSTSAFAIHLEETGIGFDGLSAYNAGGSLPNEPAGVVEYFPLMSFHDDYSEILAWAARSINGWNSVAIASGKQNYTDLNQTQCEVTFAPTAFNITVDTTAKTIKVTTFKSSTDDIEPTGNLTFNAINSLNLLSRMSGTLYQPVLGDALSLNTVNMAHRLSLQDSSSNDDAITLGVADSFAAIIDDILVAYGASQLINAQDTTSQAATGDVKAVRIGARVYIELVFALNALIIVGVLFEAVRTQCWAKLVKFNPLDIKSVIISASAGGDELARLFARRCRAENLPIWDGDARHSGLRNLEVGLVESTAVPDMLAVKSVSYDGDLAMTTNSTHQIQKSTTLVEKRSIRRDSVFGFPIAVMGSEHRSQSENLPLMTRATI